MSADTVDVLLVSTYDTDGVGKFTRMLGVALGRLGYSARIVCVRNRSGAAESHGLLDASPILRAVQRVVAAVDQRLIRRRSEFAFVHMLTLPEAVVLNADVWPKRCRLIITTFLSGMMTPKAFTRLRANVGGPPVIFYGVDMNFYTGGCHYALGCTGYQQGCADCPAVPSLLRSLVRMNFEAKKTCYRRMFEHTVVSSSHEHHQQIVSSTLFRHSDVRRMLMAVDENLYGRFEASRGQLRSESGLTSKILLLRSSSEPRKGCDMFVEAIRILGRQSSEVLKDLVIVAIGDQHVAQLLRDESVRVHSPGYIHDENELARLYAMADFFVNPSLADGGPVMLAQALMSGTPAITTDVGLARDLVHPPGNGLILDRPCAEDLAIAIREFCRMPDDQLRQMRREARERALTQIGEEGYLKGLSALMGDLIGAP